MMRTLSLAVLATMIATQMQAQTADQKAIAQAFDRYQTLSAQGKIGEAFQLTSKSTKDYFTGMLAKAKSLKKPQVMALPMSEKMAVLALRNTTTDDELRKMSVADMYKTQAPAKAFDARKKVALGEITVSGNTATASLASTGKGQMPFGLPFVKEGGAWKFDMGGLMQKLNAMMNLMGGKMGGEEQVLKMVEGTTKKKVDATIWNTVQ